MTAAVLALALVAAIIIVPAVIARRSSAGHRRLREHHRALDTLGHITATRPDGTTERSRSGFSALHSGGRPSVLSRHGLATDAAGPQAHVRVVSPGSHEPLPGHGHLAEPSHAPGDVTGIEPVAPLVSPPLPEEYQAAGQPTVRADNPDPNETTSEGRPASVEDDAPSVAEPGPPAVGPGPSGTPPDEWAPEGRPSVAGPGPLAVGGSPGVAFSDEWAGESRRGAAVPVPPAVGSGLGPTVPDESDFDARSRAMFPGADPTVVAWHPPSTSVPDTAWPPPGPSFPESEPVTSDEHAEGVITAPVPVTDPRGDEEGPAEDAEPARAAAPTEAHDRPVWRPAQPEAAGLGFGAPRGRVDDRWRHRRRPPRRAKAKRGRVAGGVAVVIVLAAGGVLAAHELSGPAAKSRGHVSAPPSTTTTATAPPSTRPPRSTTVPTVAPPPFKLISTSPGISVYRIVGRPRITITATGECWTEILRGDANGASLYVQTMTAGVRHAVRGPVWIRLGDPTAVTITVNGTKVDPPVTDGSPYDLQFE